MSAIFLSVPRALHFAYVIQAYPPGPESIMAKIMRQFVKESEVWDPRPMKLIDFGGLNQADVRAQCGLIRDMVMLHLNNGKMHQLEKPEAAVIRARYGLTNYVDVDGLRRYYFDRERTDAIKFLATRLQPHYCDLDLPVMDCLIARAFVDRKQTPITLRAIAEQFGKSHTHYRRRANDLEERLIAYENRALDTLTPYFVEMKHGESIA